MPPPPMPATRPNDSCRLYDNGDEVENEGDVKDGVESLCTLRWKAAGAFPTAPRRDERTRAHSQFSAPSVHPREHPRAKGDGKNAQAPPPPPPPSPSPWTSPEPDRSAPEAALDLDLDLDNGNEDEDVE